MIVLQVSQFAITHTDSRHLQQNIYESRHIHTLLNPNQIQSISITDSRLQNIPINNTILNPTPPQNLQVPLPSICIFTTITPTSANMQHPRNRSSRSRSRSQYQPIPPFRPQIVLKHPKSTKVPILLSLDNTGCVTARDSTQSRSFP